MVKKPEAQEGRPPAQSHMAKTLSGNVCLDLQAPGCSHILAHSPAGAVGKGKEGRAVTAFSPAVLTPLLMNAQLGSSTHQPGMGKPPYTLTTLYSHAFVCTLGRQLGWENFLPHP